MLFLPPEKLKKMFVDEGLIKPEEFDRLAIEAGRKQQNIVDVLVSRGFATMDYFYELLAKLLAVNRIELRNQKISDEILDLLPRETAQNRRVLIFSKEADGTLFAAMEDPTNLNLIEFLERRLQAKIKPFLASDDDLTWGFSLYEARLVKDFQKIIEEKIGDSLKLLQAGEENLAKIAGELPIVSIVENILAYAASGRASDIHLEIVEECLLVRFRVDGVLQEIIRIPKEIQPALVARLKLMAGLRIDEHSRPQDGRLRFQSGRQQIDIRMSVMPTFYGEKIVMRLLPATQKPISFSEIGMLDDAVKTVEEGIKKTFGMLLVCGPTGSGKTTTLYSVLNVLNRPEVNIVTVEDPIEYNIRYVNQTQVNPAANITFANGLRAILRQDPNIIMIGEIRDNETAEIAVHAALTGHLVLTSLHTNDAPTAVPRLIDMGIPPFLAAAVINLIIAQRLTRRIHQDCVESYAPDETILRVIQRQLTELGLSPKEIRLPKILYRGKGCSGCGFTGYFGRVAIFETLNFTDEIRKEVISPNFSLDELKKMARQQGMIGMFEDGLKKVELGMTTIDEVLRTIRE